MAKGIEQGIERGVGQGQARLLTPPLERRFRPLPEQLARRVQAATPEQLDAWGLGLLEATSLGDVFGPDGGH